MKLTRLLRAFRVALENGVHSFQNYYNRGFDPLARDELTLAFNRRQFDRRRLGLRAYSLLLIDLDNFKTINDVHGHQVGDEVLKAVAGALRIGSGDRVFRIGGEEFAVLLRCDPHDARGVAERLCRLVSSLKILEGEPVTVSVGVAWTGPDLEALDHDSIYRLADRALYVAKGRGKNRVTCMDELPEASASLTRAA